MRKWLFLPLFFAAQLLGPVAVGNEGDGAFSPRQALDLDRSFETQRNAITRAMADGETYSEIAPEDRKTVIESLDRISGLLDGVQSVQQLSEADKVRVFNEQEQVNTILTQAHADSRLVCRRERPTGSHRPVNSCMTVAERRRASEAAADALRNRGQAASKSASP